MTCTLLRNGYPSNAFQSEDFQLTTRNHWFSKFLETTLYQGNPVRNHKFWNTLSTEIYTPGGGLRAPLKLEKI